jgi:hypothetical protein
MRWFERWVSRLCRMIGNEKRFADSTLGSHCVNDIHVI